VCVVWEQRELREGQEMVGGCSRRAMEMIHDVCMYLLDSL
jgi:hypothetical protein